MATKDRTALKDEFKNGNLATGERFADLIDSMKVVQLPVVDPQALGTSLSFIDSISQDADGKITATKKTLDLANAHELNPFKGWYKTGDTLPTDGFDGAYLYFKDTSELTGQTTIYRWNGTTYADTGTVVDTSNVQTFGSGQAVNDVKIKDENGEEVTGNADVLSAEAGEKMGGVLFFNEEKSILTPADYSIVGFVRPAGTTSTNSAYRTAKVLASNYTGCHTIKIKTKTGAYSASPICFFDANDEVIKINNVPVSIEPTAEQANAVTEYTIDIPEGSAYFLSSIQVVYVDVNGAPGFYGKGVYNTNLKDYYTERCDSIDLNINNKNVYVSVNGSDSNDGLKSTTPFKTFKKAINSFSRNMNLVVLEGDYTEVFNLNYFRKVIGKGTVRFITPDVALSVFTEVEGHPGVYSISFASSIADSVSLWQKDVDDVNTEITSRLSYHGTRTYRLPHTRLLHKTSITELETSSVGWYLDTTEQILYVKPASSDFVTHPICRPNAGIWEVNGGIVDIDNVEFHFTNLSVLNSNSTIRNVRVFCPLGTGGLRWDGSIVTFEHCEVGGCYSDGINGHTSGKLTCIDCYAHDNGDDGESCHENCQVFQTGGLYEYNANGCTPASGGTGNYIGTICRNNQKTYPWAIDQGTTSGSGFSAQGGTMLLNSCLSVGNRIGIQKSVSDVVTAINCKSVSNTTSDSDGIIVF